MITRTPRSAAVDEYSATPRGSRCAESTRSSFEIPRSFNSTTAGSMTSRSDSEPMRIPTSGPAPSYPSRIGRVVGTSWRCDSACDMHRPHRDVGSKPNTREIDLHDGAVCPLARLGNRVACADDVEHAASGRHELPVPERCSCMEDERACRLGDLDAADRDAALRRVGIPGRGEDDRAGGRRTGRELDSGKLPVRGGGERLEEIAFETGKEGLGFRVAEATVELENSRPFLGQHQAGIEQPGKRHAAAGQLRDHGAMNEPGELLDVVLAEERNRRVASHSAGIRALVAVEQPLEALRGRERHHGVPVAEREERDLLALEQLLDDDIAPESLRALDGLVGLTLCPAHEDALSGREPVGFDHARRVRLLEPLRGRHCCGFQYLLGEALGAFDLSGRLAGAEDGHTGAAELVSHAGDERRLRPDHDKVDLVLAAEAEKALDIVEADRMAPAERGDSRVSGRSVKLRQGRALGDLPGKRMLASARAHHENVHVRESRSLAGGFKYRGHAVGGRYGRTWT